MGDRIHLVNLNSIDCEYVNIIPTSSDVSSAYTVTYVPPFEMINISTAHKTITIETTSGYFYSPVQTISNGITFDSSNTFASLLDSNNQPISQYTSVTSSSPNYIRCGNDTDGYRFFERSLISGTNNYFILLSKSPSSDSLRQGEIAIGHLNGTSIFTNCNDYNISGNERYQPYSFIQERIIVTVLDKTTYYGTCSTASGTVAKTVTIDSNIPFTLIHGTRLVVRFSNENTATDPTLNVNNTGAYPIMYNSNNVKNEIKAGMSLLLVYSMIGNNHYEIIGITPSNMFWDEWTV